jgi:cobalt-zinc-cadmium efflux system outer membrane protein
MNIRCAVGAVCVLTLAASAQGLAQAPVTRLSLDEAVSLATRANPTLRAKGFEHQSVLAGEITAGLRPNPTLGVGAEQITPGGPKGGGDAWAIAQYTVSVGQTIELGGKRERRIDSARAATRVSGHELIDVQRQVLFQVKKAFTDAQAARDGVALAMENLAALDEVERLQQVRAAKGDISELELLRIQVQRFAFERDAADARQALRTAKIALRGAVGPDVLAEDFEIVGELAVRGLAVTPADLHRLAQESRPDLAAADAARRKAEADIRLARANAWTDITPGIEYQRIGDDNTIGFVVSVPLRIFDRNQGEVTRAQAEARRAAAARGVVAVQVLSEVDTALTALRTEEEKLTMLRETYLPKARRARDTVEYAYRRGGASLLDYLDAQRTYRDTSAEYLRALGSYWTAFYQLEAAVGGALAR